MDEFPGAVEGPAAASVTGGLGWTVRVGLVLGTLLVVGLGSLAVLFLGIAQVQEETCPQNAPRGATYSLGPRWVGPTTFECAYGGAPDLRYQDTEPLGAAVVILVPAAATILLVGNRVLVRPWRRRHTVARA